MDILKQQHGPDYEPDIVFFKDLAAKAILYKRAEKIARTHAFPGYRANVITYTLALLSYRTAGRLPLFRVWQAQDTGVEVADLLYAWMPEVFDALVASAAGRNVTEWCKNEGCWRHLQTRDLEISAEVLKLLVEGEALPTVGAAAGRRGEGLTFEDRENIARVMAVPPGDWLAVLEGASREASLSDWQVGIASTLAGYSASGWKSVPSKKQAFHGVKILAIADEKRWRRNGAE
jgi:hypothetical protein